MISSNITFILGVRIVDPSKELVKKVSTELNLEHISLQAALTYDAGNSKNNP
jgi:hypothetical protein